MESLKQSVHRLGWLLTLSLMIGPLWAQEGSPQPARGGRGGSAGVYKARVTPHWFAGGTRFWYRNDLRGGEREFVVVDAVKGLRELAFDHTRVAEQMGAGVLGSRLPVNELRYSADGHEVVLVGEGARWVLDLQSGRLQTAPAEVAEEGRTGLEREALPRPSARTGGETQITFDNRSDGEVEVFWLDAGGERQSYGKVAPGTRRDQHTFGGHVWMVVDTEGAILGVFEATEDADIAVVDGSPPVRAGARPRGARSGRRRGGGGGEVPSPDGRWAAFVRDHDVYVRRLADEGQEVQLSRDGRAEEDYGGVEWSPDSKHLVAWRIRRVDRKEVYLLRSSPREGGRAQLEKRPYALPGDAFPQYELNLFDLDDHVQTKPAVDRFEHEWLSPNLHWWPGTTRFTYAQVERGHQRYRILEVDAAAGTVRPLIDERSDTFIWTAHMEGPERLGLRIVTYLDDSREMLYASERDGWRHLYLINADAGGDHTRVTQGPWVVRGLDRVDEEQRQIWFKASGVNRDQDPYLIHFYRVNFDGSGLVALTEGDGNHAVEFSPDGTYLVDTYSRVDLPPVTELRRSVDGSLVCRLERADVTELKERGWAAPEVFSAKGRDGQTDIWGIIIRPRVLDPGKRYPVVEDIYAGPQDSFVPKSFSAADRYASLTDRGFVVVKIDGMGTANRSKAFHDVCYRNLKDGGLADRILWMQAAAVRYPYLDLSRVGVYGTSAGGQNAAAAVLFHPEFYSAAAANCGCHDNRMDKASWNEQWMGYIPGDKIYEDSPENWYAQSSNIEHADQLRGHLFLCVGEMDSNVPPESTFRLVDALIRADKDFELLVVPNGGHGAGGDYYRRRMEDFFVRHLQGLELPNRNGAGGLQAAGR